MKEEERIAKRYLEALGIGNVIHEPDGNIPPDFSVASSTGVEVRRLNQNYFGEDHPQGLEELRIPLWKILEKETTRCDNQFRGETYRVFANCRRPAKENGRRIANSIRNALEDFLRRGGKAEDELIVNDNLKLIVIPSNPVQGRVFLWSRGTDRDASGWPITQYVDNLSYCIKEKSQKIAPYEHRYKIWWLILVNFILFEIDESEVRSSISSLGRFSRVTVIGKHDDQVLFDLKGETA